MIFADDHPLAREGLRALLGSCPSVEVLGEASDGEEAVRLALEDRPDVAVLDAVMPRLGGAEAAYRLRRMAPEVRCVIVSLNGERESLRRLVESGARGFVLHGSRPADVLAAVREVHLGRVFFSPEVAAGLREEAERSAGSRAAERHGRLTARETEVLALVARGLTSREIAGRLGLGTRTVDTHRERLMSKLDLHNTAGLTRYAICEGLIDLRKTT